MEQMILIHAPREGSDQTGGGSMYGIIKFQSTLPVRGATLHWPSAPKGDMDFNPRSP